MRIVRVETIRPEVQKNICFVRLHADNRLSGLGEAFFGSRAVEAYLHETAAPVLLTLESASPEFASRALSPYTGYQGGGAETRGNGAVDVALWDLLGKSANMPLAQLLGGPVRDSIETYNTCAGSQYINDSPRQTSANWGLDGANAVRAYEDLTAFLEHPAELARELWDEGIRGMKVWPFDRAAEANDGLDISPSELAQALSIVEGIREEVGFEMKVMVELHGLWSRRAATVIADALTPLRPFWIEDPLRADQVTALASLRRDIDVAVALGETAVGRRGFQPLLDQAAVDIVTMDVGWTGGITEARKIASLADMHGTPIAPHDCTGPVSLAVGAHLAMSAPNGLIQETARAFYRTWYDALADGFPTLVADRLYLNDRPGHGVTLLPGLETSRQAITQTSE